MDNSPNLLIDDRQTWAERPAAGFDAGLCTNCREIKPIRAFRRTLSRAQAKVWGYEGNHRYETTSKLCQTCQPRKRWLEELTPTQIGWMLKHGDIDPVTAQAVLDKRDREKNAKKSAALHKRWQSVRAMAWMSIILEQIKPLSKVVNVQTFRARRKLGVADPTDKPRFQPLVDFFQRYQEVLWAARGVIAFKASTAAEMPESYEWRTYVKPEHRQELAALWRAIPAPVKLYYTTPDVLSDREDRRPPPKPTEGHIGMRTDSRSRLSQIK